MRVIRIAALGTYLPKTIVSNRELAPLAPPLSLAQLERFGIESRGHAGEGESVVEMANFAAQKALDEACLSAESLDFILLSNWTSRRHVPDVAPQVQHQLGAKNAFALDLCGACCGFILALATAHGFLQNPRYRRGLVLASDRASHHMRPGSRSTVVFGDGAAAAVVEADGERGFRIADYELKTDGAHNGIMSIDDEGYLDPHIKQRDLIPLAGRSMAESAMVLLDRNQMKLADVDKIIPHSGTSAVQEQLRENLGVSAEQVFTNLPRLGNVTSASIPCSLREALDSGEVKTSDTVLCMAVGLGWHHVAMLLKP